MRLARRRQARVLIFILSAIVTAHAALAVPLPEPRPQLLRPAAPVDRSADTMPIPAAPAVAAPALPEPRPARFNKAPAPASVAEAAKAPALPEERPPYLRRIDDVFKGVPYVTTPLPPPRPPKQGPIPPSLATPPVSQPPAQPPANPLASAPDADPACAALAANKQVVFEPLPAISAGACGAPSPIKVTAITLETGGKVTISPSATMRCSTAQALADWVRGGILPAAQTHLNEPITELRTAASYDCRGRNRVKGAKLSEHGKANAFDVGAFRRASGDWIEVGKAGKAQPFFDAVRKNACGPFTTVLGPGSDGYHEEHLHVDLAQRGRAKRALYCR